MGIKHQPSLTVHLKCFNNSGAPFENFNVLFLTVIHEINKTQKKIEPFYSIEGTR